MRAVPIRKLVCLLNLMLLLTLCGVPALHAQLQQTSLNDGWSVRALHLDGHPEAQGTWPAMVPGVIQTDLVRAHVIPDPFFGANEKRLQWVGDTDWEYTRTIEVTPAMLRHAHLELVFDGLDTFADVSLNGVPLLSADNMFRTWRADVKGRLQPGQNRLAVVFHAPRSRLTPMIAKLPYILPGTGYEKLDRAQGIYPLSQYVRMAPYNFGWDWGPRFVTEGIWRPVRLELWDRVRAESFHMHQDAVTAVSAALEAQLAVRSDLAGAASLHLEVTSPDGRRLPPQTLAVQLQRGENLLRLPLQIEQPARWYPNGYGAQSRYHFTVSLTQGSHLLVRQQMLTGLRSVELHRQPDAAGTSFNFVVNGIPVFAKGANVVPMDSFPSRVTDAQRRTLLTAARDVHMNMLRIWGGGYYETDSFYDLCDELGLMVWQDFMFGGGMVPGDQAFQANVQAEAVEQVARLSDHPSMALWCGNNEVESAWSGWDDVIAFKKSLSPDDRERVWQDYVVMFRDILKQAVTAHGNGVPYWPSTPGANFDQVPPGQRDGDEHSWKVWSAGAPPTDYRKVDARFISEFGFQSMPDRQTVRAFAGDDENLKSPLLTNHERFIHGFDRMQMYLDKEFGPARDFDSFVYLSQVMQAEAIQTGVEHWRAARPQTMGTLYWQLDDCWPVASWSSIDYFGRWKALQYYAARFYAPLLIAAEAEGNTLKLHVVSDEQMSRQATLHVRLLRFDGTLVEERSLPVTFAPLASTPLPDLVLEGLDPKTMVAVLTLEQGSLQIARNTLYFATARDLALPAATPQAVFTQTAHGLDLELRSPVLARDVDLNFGALEVKPNDNFFDLLPNQPYRVHLTTHASLAEVKAALHVRSQADAMRAGKHAD